MKRLFQEDLKIIQQDITPERNYIREKNAYNNIILTCSGVTLNICTIPAYSDHNIFRYLTSCLCINGSNIKLPNRPSP